MLRLFLIIRGNRGPIPSFLSGCSIGSGSNNIGIGSHLQKTIRQRYSLRQYWAAKTWNPRAITFSSKIQLIGRDPNCASRCVQVKVTGSMGIGSCIVARGLGPWPGGPGALPRTRGWGYGPYHRARVQGPKGLGTPYRTIMILCSSYSKDIATPYSYTQKNYLLIPKRATKD